MIKPDKLAKLSSKFYKCSRRVIVFSSAVYYYKNNTSQVYYYRLPRIEVVFVKTIVGCLKLRAV